ncbi:MULTISPECIES: hypothetical protein [Idiomarina]|uniref:hypothetical protein n=1 Tax=Idiomarina TaxID=135575 RepID=UPI00129B1DEC|nr:MULTISPECIES: hypothetical protein [Idiomarina]MRJ41201.1 hypothetical protein [Idiomarina sp. FeN1]NCU56366.1 hypothetical protein [Idiomarina sp. FenA--70]NCU59385.1 hypothetical protein [Idiomarina sp. FenBw--71]UUN12560.1 hypothetical protein KGF88_07780 [Idiomarina loihiensis]
MPPAIAAVAAGIAAGVAASSVVVGIAVAIGTVALQNSLKPEMPGVEEAVGDAQSLTTQPRQPHRGVYGECVVSGSIIGYGKRRWNDGEAHVVAVSVAGHKMTEIKLYEVNGKPAPNGTQIEVHLGDQTTASPTALQHCDGWSQNHIGFGRAYAVVTIPIDAEEMPSGLQNITFKVKGKPVYDPRKDTTVGGDGPHRANDDATWEWSDNSILCALDYNRFHGYRQLSLNKFDIGHLMDQANICDEMVDFNASDDLIKQEKRYTCNGSWTFDQAPPRVLERLLSSCGGRAYRRGGRIYLHTASYHGMAEVTLSDSDAAGEIIITPHRELKERTNLVRAALQDPQKGYQPTDAPVVTNALYVERDGMVLEDELQLSFTNSRTMAQRLMKYHLERNRAGMRIQFPCKSKGLLALAGKTVRVELPNEGIDKEFIVTNWSFDLKSKKVNLVLEEESPALYSDSLVPSEGDVTPNTNLPDLTQPAPPESVQFTLDPIATHRMGFVTWSHPTPRAVTEYKVVVVKDGVRVVEYPVIASSGVQLKQDISGLDAGQYSIEIYARNRYDRTSAPASVSLTLTVPAPPTSLGITPGNWEATAVPQLAGVGLGTVFEFAFGEVTNIIGRGASISQPGLVPNTNYRFWGRTVNTIGKSDWVYEDFTTTAEPEQIDPLLPESQIIQGINDTITGIGQRIDEEAGRINDTEESIEELVASTRNISYMLDTEGVDRAASDMQAMLAIANQSAARLEMERRQRSGERLIGAVVEVDSETGEITNLAYSYTDSAFTQAALRMDGIDGSINAAVERISLNEGAVENLSSELTLLPGLIEARATAIVASSISALQPAHAFNFFDSTQHWEAVTGTVAPVNNAIELTHGDIENTRLFYDATENPVLRIEVERLAGTGWSGTVIVYFDGGGSQSYPGIIDAVEAGELVVRNVDFRGLETYAGMINGMRIELGASAADEFRVKSLTIGKPDAAMQQLEQVEYRVNDAFIAIDGLQGQINLRVTSEHYNNNTVTFGNVEQTLDAIESYAQIKATYTTLMEDGTIAKANAAAIFIDGQTGTITQIVQTINNRVDDVEGQAQAASQTANQAMSEVDAANGRIRNQVISTTQNAIADAENAVAAVLEAYQGFLQGRELANTRISLASARRDLQAQSTELSAFANETLELLAVTAQEAEALEARVDQAFSAISNAEAALTQARISLQSQILGAGTDATRKATANALDLLNARIGYCELNGSPTGHETREACEDAGGTWISAPLAEALRNVQVQTEDGSYARVSQLAQAFVDDDGQLTAIGSMLTDNAGRISGMLNRNTGLESSLDFIAGQTRIGDVDGEGNFIPLFWLDAAAGVLAIKARLILGDGHQVNTLDDIRGQDGEQGPQGPEGPQGPVGPQGVPGEPGADGEVYYTWIRYADDASGTGISNDPTGKTYMGLAHNKTSATESNDPADYTWSRFRGEDGTDGVQGPPGADGQTTYTWIAYSDNANGDPMYQTPNSNTKYIGIATNKTTASESNDPADYTWSRFRGEDGEQGPAGAAGSDGANGAGFYGGTWPDINWSLGWNRFVEVAGRNPIAGDILVQTRSDGTGSSAQKRNTANNGWEPVALQINGSMVATGTIAGDKFIAGTSLNAPVIMSGQIQMVGSTHMKITTATPFGPNDLIEWYGPKNTYTYNSSTGTVKFDGLTKANAITYLSSTGQAYFGGSITAGTLKNAVQSSQLGNTDVTVGPFGSNGGIIEIKCSVSASRSTGLVSGSCPSPAPPNPSATLKLYRVTSGGETLVATQSVSGLYTCMQEGPEHIESWNLSGSFTYTDNLQTTSSRTYRLEVSANTTPLLPNGNQRLSLITEEA